uniref:Uncharacterized protein n=1 Tax=Romanomermis culicivorax TaxID=13658 RepID=A0A915L5D0_ROMCU
HFSVTGFICTFTNVGQRCALFLDVVIIINLNSARTRLSESQVHQSIENGSSTKFFNEWYMKFVLRKKGAKVDDDARDSFIDTFLQKFLQQQTKSKEKEYPDLCMLPELTEQTLMENLK